jgi:AraC-like DNA-binding protein
MKLPANAHPLPRIVAFAPRERARTLIRAALPRRRARLSLTRTVDEFEAAFRSSLVDSAIVDVSAATDDGLRCAALAREFPSIPFFALVSPRVADAPVLAQCVALEFADVLVESIDDHVLRDLVLAQGFSTRFCRALAEPPRALNLESDLQLTAWRCIVVQGGRPVRTSALAQLLDVTREHLSRSFASGAAPNLKRVIDLVRLIAAAELAKNPGYDVRDVAQVLDFASSSHLSSTSQRIVGTRPASLARLRTVDIVERFAQGHRRSRSGSYLPSPV